jgi:DNA-binding protein HU-beta
MGGTGKGAVDKFGDMAGQPKTAVTSALKGSTAAGKTTAAGTTSKLPNLASKTAATTGKTLTSAGTGAAKVTGAKATGTTGTKTSGSNIGSKLTSALAGAALGAGTKFAIDKLTGAKTTKTVDTTKAGTKGVVDTAKKVVDTSKKVVDTTGAKKVIDTTGAKKVVDTTGAKKVVDTTKTGTKVTGPTSVVKKTGTNTGTPPFVPKGSTAAKTTGSKSTAPATRGAAGAVAAKTAADIKAENPELTDEEVQAELDRIKAEEESFGVPEGAEQNEDGTYSVTEDGMVTTYDADGNIVGMEAATDGSFGEDTGDAGDDVDTTSGDDGTTTQVLDDGTVVTFDSSGEIVSYTDADGVEYDADGEVIDGSDTLVTGDDETEEDAYEGLYSDDEGNLYDLDGNLVEYADGTLVGDDEFTEDEVAYTDEYGNTYDENGEIVDYAEGYVSEDEYGTEDEYTSEDGYTSEDEYAAEDEYSDEDEYSYEDEIDYDVKKGGLINMADGGSLDEPIDEKQNADGTITQMFDDGSSIVYNQDGEVVKVSEAKKFEDGGEAYSDTDEEVQDWQNVDYNYGEYDDPTMTGDNSLYSASGPIQNTYLRSLSSDADSQEWPEGYIDNGDGTATYVDDDGSTVTIDADSNIVFVTDADGEVVVQNNEPVTTGGLTQAGQGNIQYFDDGSSIETFDDGSTITYDADGNVFKATDAYETTYDDEGNAIVTDGFGNIVSVYDPQGNVIPLGGGRVTGPTKITGGGGGGATDITQNPTIQQRVADQNLDKDTKSAIDSLLAGLNTYGGAGAAGAVIGALLSDTDLFGGGTGSTGGNFDMTGVGSIAPRTTDFGIGPARYVGYDEYGTPEQMPELYGQELYQNLNAPGFNEVNPGDYARMDAEASGLDEYLPEEQQVEGMADGGMPQGGLGQTAPQTYYTFGKPVDPLQNLRNPTPFQQQPQQQQMPPQAAQNAQQMPPQQALPQMGMAPTQPSIPQGIPPAGAGMKSGGLPAWSNVPITQGRLNFRQGAAVHGAGDGQSDDIPAMLADGEYVIDAETVAQIGNGSTKAGAQALDKFRENIRKHKRSAPVNKIPPKTKALTSYLKGAR